MFSSAVKSACSSETLPSDSGSGLHYFSWWFAFWILPSSSALMVRDGTDSRLIDLVQARFRRKDTRRRQENSETPSGLRHCKLNPSAVDCTVQIPVAPTSDLHRGFNVRRGNHWDGGAPLFGSHVCNAAISRVVTRANAADRWPDARWRQRIGNFLSLVHRLRYM